MTTLRDIHRLMGITTPFEEKLNSPDGIQLSKDNITFRKGIPFVIDPDTQAEYQVTIYIKNQTWLSRVEFLPLMNRFTLGYKDSRKIHLFRCRTINNMVAKGEFWKYHGSQRENHHRLILAKDGEVLEPLKVCQNCIGELQLPSRQFAPRNFDFHAFFERWKQKVETSEPGFEEAQTEFEPADHYPRDWPKISTGKKQEANWKCECCGVSLQSHRQWLHVHHKNKRKSDCRPENLEALCENCHAQRHDHMPASLHIRPLKHEQELPLICPQCGG